MRSLLVFSCLLSAVMVFATCGKTTHSQGHNLYDTHCGNCHMEDGKGLRQLIPPLAGSDWLRDNQAEAVAGIFHGMQAPVVVNGVTYRQPMPGNQDLSEFQIVNIVNYINQAWGNDYGLITVTEAREWMQKPTQTRSK